MKTFTAPEIDRVVLVSEETMNVGWESGGNTDLD